MTVIPESHTDLLTRPLFGHLATIRPDGTAQSNPVWYIWDGEVVQFTFSTKQQKHRNVLTNPHVALSIQDPEDPYRYLEVRGIVETVDPDPNGGEFFMKLNTHYNGPFTESLYPTEGGIYTMRPTSTSKQGQ
ncbi:PPOX class F420-dependent oxidoreductase [Nocardia bovistercoris]|uniref:PPOX class F420-dependent oxidoreductase n=1 Tax=Nocardia bovistercoris TaxID=2785916 RepID=A0A931IBC5_9NOCA|nr:PPOX class F420-dependent oxidoreductase [Nocardia bovistercoris]